MEYFSTAKIFCIYIFHNIGNTSLLFLRSRTSLSRTFTRTLLCPMYTTPRIDIRTMIDIFFIPYFPNNYQKLFFAFHIIFILLNDDLTKTFPFFIRNASSATTEYPLFTARQILEEKWKGRETNKNSCPVIRLERGQQLNDGNHDWKLEISNPPAHSPAAMQFPL